MKRFSLIFAVIFSLIGCNSGAYSQNIEIVKDDISGLYGLKKPGKSKWESNPVFTEVLPFVQIGKKWQAFAKVAGEDIPWKLINEKGKWKNEYYDVIPYGKEADFIITKAHDRDWGWGYIGTGKLPSSNYFTFVTLTPLKNGWLYGIKEFYGNKRLPVMVVNMSDGGVREYELKKDGPFSRGKIGGNYMLFSSKGETIFADTNEITVSKVKPQNVPYYENDDSIYFLYLVDSDSRHALVNKQGEILMSGPEPIKVSHPDGENYYAEMSGKYVIYDKAGKKIIGHNKPIKQLNNVADFYWIFNDTNTSDLYYAPANTIILKGVSNAFVPYLSIKPIPGTNSFLSRQGNGSGTIIFDTTGTILMTDPAELSLSYDQKYLTRDAGKHKDYYSLDGKRLLDTEGIVEPIKDSAFFAVYNPDNDKVGIKNASNEWVIPQEYDSFTAITDGYSFKGGPKGLSFKTNKDFVINQSSKTDDTQKVFVKHNGNKWAYVDYYDKPLSAWYDEIDPIYMAALKGSGATDFGSGIELVCRNGKWGLLDTDTYKEIVPCVYDKMGAPAYGRIRVKKNGLCGFLDSSTFQLVIPCKFYSVGNFRDIWGVERTPFAEVVLENKSHVYKTGFIDKSGNVFRHDYKSKDHVSIW